MMRSTFCSLKAAALTSGLSLGLAGTALAQEAEEPSWTDGITIGAFVDAYGALRSDNNEARDPTGAATPFQYPHEAYVQADGFALAFAGADLAYAGDQFGATISLRFGPGVVRFFGDQGPFGISNVTQAYATWKPLDGLTLDLGQFGTIFGAEVAESWRNQNYTRGALYYAMQPFWHTGLRANYAINDMFGVNAMLVNGVNTSFENNKSPTVGVQALVTPIDELFIAAGYMGALNPRDGGELTGVTGIFDHFFDVVATVTLGDFNLVSNFDFNLYDGGADNENFWGLSVAPGYAFTNWLKAAARVEYLSDGANNVFGMQDSKAGYFDRLGGGPGDPASDASLVTLTGTVEFKPIPNSGAVVLRPEFRYEIASDYYFLDGDNDASKGFWTAVLGAVVTSM
jgi:hypothetical protein